MSRGVQGCEGTSVQLRAMIAHNYTVLQTPRQISHGKKCIRLRKSVPAPTNIMKSGDYLTSIIGLCVKTLMKSSITLAHRML